MAREADGPDEVTRVAPSRDAMSLEDSEGNVKPAESAAAAPAAATAAAASTPSPIGPPTHAKEHHGVSFQLHNVHLGRFRPHRHRKSASSSVEVEESRRAYDHRYLIRLPRPRQFKRNGRIFKLDEMGREIEQGVSSGGESMSALDSDSRSTSTGSGSPEAARRLVDYPAVQRARLDLFVDLVWVGVVSNLADDFSEQAFYSGGATIGQAIVEFIILFLPAWRVWNSLRDFMNHFYVDDAVQRVFVVWILVLMLIYGNNAPYLHDDGSERKILLGIYLLATLSFYIMEAIYSIFIGWLRLHVLVKFIAYTPSFALWIAAIASSTGNTYGLAIGALACEVLVVVAAASPLMARWTGQYQKAADTEHWVGRLESFFILILGSGVFLLIQQSPVGRGLPPRTASAVCALMVFYCLHWLYFNLDMSQTYIHPTRRAWYVGLAWEFAHRVLFGALLVLGASVRVIIEHDDVRVRRLSPAAAARLTAAEHDEVVEAATTVLTAQYTASITLAASLLLMAVIALLNASRDPPGTLLVGNRYVRLAGRVVAAVVLCVLPLPHVRMAGRRYLPVVVGLLYSCMLWEWIAGLERGARWLEPRGVGGGGRDRDVDGNGNGNGDGDVVVDGEDIGGDDDDDDDDSNGGVKKGEKTNRSTERVLQV
ncbi:MAG: hypothetical protein M1819_005390 [Sarea resinae]|nr:MAG: hypothetical protein M1819_005390 [Sarea resinae]